MTEDQQNSLRQRAAASRARGIRLRAAAEAAKQRGEALRTQAQGSHAWAGTVDQRCPNIPRPEPVEGQPPRTCAVCGALMPEGVGCSLCPGDSLEQSERDYSAAGETWQAAQDAGQSAGETHLRARNTWERASTAWEQAQNTHAAAETVWQQEQVCYAASQAQEQQAGIEWEEAQTRRNLALEAAANLRDGAERSGQEPSLAANVPRLSREPTAESES